MKNTSFLFVALAALVFFNLRAEVVEIDSADALATAIAGNPSGDYKLTANIDCTGWTSLDFSGTLDGDGKTISGLTVPLFNSVTGSAQFKNIVVDGAVVEQKDKNVKINIGILAVTMQGADLLVQDIVFRNCSMTKAGSNYAGMVAGVFSGSGMIEDVLIETSCSLTAHSGCVGIGGVCGSIESNVAGGTVKLSRCVNRGAVAITDYTAYIAGMAVNVSAKGGNTVNTYAHVVLEDCSNYASLTVNKTNPSFGPLVYSFGSASSTLGDITFVRCTNHGDVSMNTYVALGGMLCTGGTGGIYMRDCVNYGNLTSTTGNPTAGLIGNLAYLNGTTVEIVGCANCGDITGQVVGGLVGKMAHNQWQPNSNWHFVSCLQHGVLSTTGGDNIAGEVIAWLTSNLEYPKIEISGSLLREDNLIGAFAADASIKEYIKNGNIFMSDSEGLVSGADVVSLNDYNACNLWKQGSVSPILKVMPDEAAPDTVTVRFVDAADYESALLKTCVILRGGAAIPPENPEHEGVTFDKWNPSDLSCFETDATVVATYLNGTLEHVVRFFGVDHTQIGEDCIVKHGDPAVAPAAPEVEGKLFIGWDKEFDNVTTDLDVSAMYVDLVVQLNALTDFAEVLGGAIYPEVTYQLTEDVALPADWKSVDFIANFDGCGHVISYAGTKPIFNVLSGSASNFVLDGLVGDAPTAITGLKANFGFIAVKLLTGVISGVTVRNYTLEVSNSGGTLNIGAICAQAGDDSRIEACNVEDSVLIRTRISVVGGIVGATTMSSSWNEGAGAPLLNVLSCTNNATIVTWYSGSGEVIGGIVGNCNSFESVRRPVIVISNCVNNADIGSVCSGSDVGGRFAGIVGERNANDAGNCGSLYILDCANYGDVIPQAPSGCIYGGIIAYQWRLGHIYIGRCRNYGTVGGAVCPNGKAVTDGMAGGVFGYISELYNEQPVCIYDTANYGDVVGGTNAAGFVACASANTGHGDTRLMITNCANYGSVSTVLETGYSGQFVGAFKVKLTPSAKRVYGAWNCFFVDDGFVGYNAGTEFVFENCKTAVDEGYASRSATKALNAWAAENGYESWIEGKVGDVVYPELAIFCTKPATAGLMVILR